MTTNDPNTTPPNGGAMTTRDMTGSTTHAETAQAGMAEAARALVESRFVMALKRPRDWTTVGTKLRQTCDRPGFAEGAMYAIKRGVKTIEGLSVRFAEAAIREAGNLVQSTRITYDDATKRVVTVSMLDLETNATYERDITIDKTIERREPRDGQVVLSERMNSAGQKVYLVVSSPDELAQKEGAEVSKAFRTLALRLIPGDILDDCEERIRATRRKRTTEDPDAARKKLCDAFASFGVMPNNLIEYLGHPLEQTTVPEIETLRGHFASIRDGEQTWTQIMAEIRRPSDDDKKVPAATVADRIRQRAGDAKADVKSDAKGETGTPPTEDKSAGPKKDDEPKKK